VIARAVDVVLAPDETAPALIVLCTPAASRTATSNRVDGSQDGNTSSWRKRSMTNTTIAQAGLTPPAVPAVATGPIVAGVGGVDPDSVLRAARVLAPASAAGVVAVAVLPPLPVSIPGETAWMIPSGYEEERFTACLSQLTTRLETFGGAATSWGRKVVHGAPAFALTNLARERHAAMLIVGIGRHRAFDRILGGETALRIIQRAPCPVFVVHPDFEGPFHDVVIATDFSPASVAAARAVIPMLGPTATLHVVHAWEPSAATDARHVAANEAYSRALTESFRRFVDLVPVPPGVSVKTIAREGKAAACVLDYAGAHHADLITAGRHGRSLLQRILVGSQTTALVRAAERSLLVAPEPAFAEREQLRLLLTGSTESTEPAEWEPLLHALSQRNRGRPTVVEVDDLLMGAQVLESGYVLRNVAYDPRTKRIEISVGDAAQNDRRVTRLIGGVNSVAIEADATGRDVGLRISHGGGQTALTFLDG
jgi:nucleotide-binding universal stress UspA family protein